MDSGESDGRGFISAHWVGELPRKSAVYINGLLLVVLCGIVEIVFFIVASELSRQGASNALLVKLAVQGALIVWYSRGAWRASARTRNDTSVLQRLSARSVVLALASIQVGVQVQSALPYAVRQAKAPSRRIPVMQRETEGSPATPAHGNPWDAVRRGLKPTLHASLTRLLEDIDLPRDNFAELETCEIERKVQALQDTGCASGRQPDDRLLPEERAQMRKCFETKMPEVEARTDVLSCWRRHVPNDWSLNVKLFARQLAEHIAPEDPESSDVRAIAACAIPRIFARVAAAGCLPLTTDARTAAGLLRLNPCLHDHFIAHQDEEVHRCGVELRRVHSPTGRERGGPRTKPASTCAEADGCDDDRAAADAV